MVRRLTLVEYQTCPAVPLAPHERDALLRLVPSITVVPSLQVVSDERGHACYDLTPGSWIGAVRLGTLAIEIRPKLPVDRVLFLISYAIDPRAWRDLLFHFAETTSLVEAIVPAFLAHVRRAIRHGLLHGYRAEEGAWPAVRGRLRFDEQVRRRFGVFPPAELRYDEYTADVDENRLLKVALVRLSRMRLRSPATARALRHDLAAFQDVSLVHDRPDQWPPLRYTRLNEHYRPALELARLIVRSTAFDLGHGPVPAWAFLVDMNQVFEDFVVVALREALGLSERTFPQGLASGARPRTLPLDQAGAVHLKPDLSWWDGNTCTFVGDVKYKRASVAGIEHPDLYQLLAYTIATGLPGGLLVYAAGEAEPASHEVVHAGKELHVTALDLSGSPDKILAQIGGVAAHVRHLRGLARAGAARGGPPSPRERPSAAAPPPIAAAGAAPRP